MKKTVAFILILLIGPVLAGLYGILHDQLTYSISPEYYTKFKFYQFAFVDKGDEAFLPNPRMSAGVVGLMATWWLGIPIALILGLVGWIFPNGKSMFRATLRAMGIVLLVAFLTGLAGLAYGHFYLSKLPETSFEGWYLPKNLVDLKSFITVGSMHNFSYLGGLIGLIVGIVYLIWQKRKMEGADINGQIKELTTPYQFLNGVLLLAWMANLFTEFSFRPQIFYGLIGLLFINQLLQIWSIATKQIPADLAIRKVHYHFNFWALSLAILWTLFVYWNRSDRIYLAMLFWMLFLATAIGHLVYSRKKPYTLLLQGATLLHNSLWLRKRNLERLKRITYDDHEGEMYFYFEGQSKLLIEPKSYEDQDLFPFIKEMIARSGKEVELSGNLKMLLGRY